MTEKKRSKFDIRHKETLTLFLKEYFELFFPDLAKKIRFETARFLDKELITLFGENEENGEEEDKADEYRITDAMILVQILLGKKLEWIMIHWEQESQKRQKFEERVFHYFCGIYFSYRIIVFPIAMFTDSAKWRKPVKNKFSLSLDNYPIIKEFTYNIIKLKNYKAEDFEKRIDDNPLAAAYLPLTDYPKKERPLIKAKAMKGISKVPTGKKQGTLFSLIQESIRLDSEEEKQFRELVRDNPMYKEVKMLQSVKEVGIEEGIEIGMEKGQIQTSEDIAKNLLLSGKLTKQEIAGITGVRINRISELARDFTDSGKRP
ncbi:MAG: hypothetical protein GY795_01415 [Desulfobacterales bacterium]|nr:hypothetical protein [Desulfobacterales bacterium]